MLYRDLIYGEVKIEEPVVLELINSKTIQRLKNIDQSGYPQPWFPDLKTDNFENTRFAHSLGVYNLLNRYKAPLEEQVAGLIHDVSHSAFSHCIDYILGSQKEHNHQDNIFEEFVRKSEIPEILKKYKLDLDYILNDENFPLKERELPDLCADRIDYSLRTGAALGKEVRYLLTDLTAGNGNWLFKNFESAKKYAEFFLELNKNYYAGIKSALMFKTVSDYLKYALEKNYIKEDDFYKTDTEVLGKIGKYHDKDEKLKLLFDRMNNKIGFTNNPKDFESHIYCKSRIVDPLFLGDGKSVRLSNVLKEWVEIVKKESVPKEYFLKFEE